MSQAEAPRQYKFVGAFSRKRRRRNGTMGSTAVASSPQGKPAAVPSVPASTLRSAIGEDTGKALNTGRIPLTGHAPELPTISPVIPVNCEEAGETMAYPSNEDFFHLQDQDWSCPSLMSPFFDLDSSFLGPIHDINSHHLPNHFGTDIPPIRTEDTPSTDDASHSQIDDIQTFDPRDESTFQPSTSDEILLPPPKYQGASCNISLTISQLLTRYDQEFCVMPLTHDFEANPFRFDAKTGRGSQLLLHCILALSYKHMNRDTGSYADEARTHKKKALQMLREMENASQSAALEATFLDAVLILMTLDCAASAHGPWAWYLRRAHKMIQVADFASIRKTPRMQACVEILIWWDVTLALTSRQGCVLSENTIASLFGQDKSRNETFYSVSGCPEPLFLQMIHLGTYAREFEVVSNMTCVKLDMEPVLQVERQIGS